MAAFAVELEQLSALNQVVVPDLWQQQAVGALRAGRDVVVQAPTGAGKTLIFELWTQHGRGRGQAIYTVPTRALANDKLAEWRARGWDVGIATGDLAENLDAPILVATLETQKHRLIRGEGPALLVVDEFQMIGDADRGLNYEIAIALAPRRTQLLLLSGSVANPQDVVKWLRRLGRDALLVRHDERPVPLDEVHPSQLSYRVPDDLRGYWPRTVAKVLAEDLGPLLLFAPRRQVAEGMAADLARQLPTPNPLLLTPEQKALVDESLARMLKARVAYHHSGLSYGARAGVIEPLAKAGQLRVVVATMGLAAGINFSLRSVALAGDSYRRDEIEQPLRPDEILQMFGRAGRRGLDETGYVIIAPNEIRLLDAHPGQLSRSGMVDWGALLGLMHTAAEQGRDPFTEAVRAQERLFTSKPIVLGVEVSLKHPDAPCGLKTDAERARHVRHRVREMLNSRGEWQRYPPPGEVALEEVWVTMEEPDAGCRGLESRGAGNEACPQNPAEQMAGSLSEGKEAVPVGTPEIARSEAPIGDGLKSAPPGSVAGEAAGAAPGFASARSRPVTFRLAPALSAPMALERIGQGTLVVVGERPFTPALAAVRRAEAPVRGDLPRSGNAAAGEGVCAPLRAEAEGPPADGGVRPAQPTVRIYGRALTAADKLQDGRVVLSKWVRRLTNWRTRVAPLGLWEEKIAPLLEQRLTAQNTPLVRFVTHGHRIHAYLSLARHVVRVPVDAHGIALLRPREREVLPEDCARCALLEQCRQLPTATGTALLWRRLNLVDAHGGPTRRGRIVSFFHQGDGLALAAALEDESYPLDELIYDLANLDAGFRFCGEDNRWAGRLAVVCHERFGLQSIPGYLENGLPPKYGAGAEQIVAAVHKNPAGKHRWVTDVLGPGDIDRIIIEWRSRLRQIAHAPDLEWPRWRALQAMARGILRETESPTLTDLPPLAFHQTRRVDHRLQLRRH